jgi:WD40 repeat protein
MSGETIAVVGAGPAGAMMALTLARRGFSVDVYEKRADWRLEERGGGGGEGAGGGLLRLWDIRANACARQLFGGHVNRVHACGAALSPCLTYAAVGSEDRCAVVYDLRTGRPVAKLRGAGDAVTSVAWSPLACALAAGSLDGGVRFYAAP